MPSFGTIALFVVSISAVFAHPHGASAGREVHSDHTGASARGPAAVTVGTEEHANDTGYLTEAKTQFSPSKTADGDVLSKLLHKLVLLNDRDLNEVGTDSSEDCSATVTVTTKLQVTVSVTADSSDAGTTKSFSYVEQKVVQTTPMTATSASSRRHHHASTGYRARPHGSSASGSHASSIVKPSRVASQVQASSSPATSLAAVKISVTSTQAAIETYTLPSVLSELSSDVGQSSLLRAVQKGPVRGRTSALPFIHTTSIQSTKSSSSPLTQTSTVHSTTSSTSSLTSHLTLPSFTPPAVQTTFATSAKTSATPSSTYPSNKGKRGLAYNDAGLTAGFASSSQISWAYNWGSSTSGLADGLKYIPTLWSSTASFTKSWQANAQKAIASGSTHLFSFNEPDLGSQANLTPEIAAAAYKTYLHDMFGGGSTKLCAPAITNGGGSMGFTWLKNFIAACPSCQIDCLNVHWYGDSESDFERHITDAIALADGREIWVSEFALNGSPSSATVQTFLQKAMAFLDNTGAVAGYAYFMASQGRLVDGSSPSNPVGITYMG